MVVYLLGGHPVCVNVAARRLKSPDHTYPSLCAYTHGCMVQSEFVCLLNCERAVGFAAQTEWHQVPQDVAWW